MILIHARISGVTAAGRGYLPPRLSSEEKAGPLRGFAEGYGTVQAECFSGDDRGGL